jgi:hypothetical protein
MVGGGSDGRLWWEPIPLTNLFKKGFEPVFDVYGLRADYEKKRADDPLYWPHGESSQAAILFSVRTVQSSA